MSNTIREMLNEIVSKSHDVLVDSTLTIDEMDKEFDSGWGLFEIDAFTAWGEKFVYTRATAHGNRMVTV